MKEITYFLSPQRAESNVSATFGEEQRAKVESEVNNLRCLHGTIGRIVLTCEREPGLQDIKRKKKYSCS